MSIENIPNIPITIFFILQVIFFKIDYEKLHRITTKSILNHFQNRLLNSHLNTPLNFASPKLIQQKFKNKKYGNHESNHIKLNGFFCFYYVIKIYFEKEIIIRKYSKINVLLSILRVLPHHSNNEITIY